MNGTDENHLRILLAHQPKAAKKGSLAFYTMGGGSPKRRVTALLPRNLRMDGPTDGPFVAVPKIVPIFLIGRAALISGNHFDLILSGHTHGGQYFPYNFLIWMGNPYFRSVGNANSCSVSTYNWLTLP